MFAPRRDSCQDGSHGCAATHLGRFQESHALADEDADYPHDLSEALFGYGSRPGDRILFTVIEDDVIVPNIQAAEQDSITPGDSPLPR